MSACLYDKMVKPFELPNGKELSLVGYCDENQAWGVTP